MLQLIASIKVWHLILSLIVVVGILSLTACGAGKLLKTGKHVNQAVAEQPMKLMAVCTDTPSKTVACTWIPLEEKHRTEAEQKLYKERN